MTNSGRHRLPETRASIDRRFEISYVEPDPKTGALVRRELKLYVVAGLYEDNRIGELFFRGAKQGELLSGALDMVATAMSIGLQHGVPLKTFTDKMRGVRFGPHQQFGLKDKDFSGCTSVFDLIARWLDLRFPDGVYAP